MMSGTKQSLAAQVFVKLTNRSLIEEHFPMLLRTGIPDIGPAIHSHFLTLLVGVGQSMNYSVVAECPIWWAPERGLGDVRPDSVWFEKERLRAQLVFEFERFERGDESKLRGKVENLAIASQTTDGLALCVLIYWVRSGSAPRSMESIVTSYRDGFRRNGQSVPPARTPLMIVKSVLRQSVEPELLVFGEFLRDERNERLALGTA